MLLAVSVFLKGKLNCHLDYHHQCPTLCLWKVGGVAVAVGQRMRCPFHRLLMLFERRKEVWSWRETGRGLDLLWRTWVEGDPLMLKSCYNRRLFYFRKRSRKLFQGIVKTAYSPYLLYLTITHRPEGTQWNLWPVNSQPLKENASLSAMQFTAAGGHSSRTRGYV